MTRSPATLALLLIGMLAVPGCERTASVAGEDPPVVRVERVGGVLEAPQLEFAGEVRARYETPLAFRVGGKIVERHVQMGTRVKAGDAIARLDPTDLALAYDAAKAQRATLAAERDLTARELERFRGLRDRHFVSEVDLERRQGAYDSAKTNLDAAEARLRQAANQLAYATLAADGDGVITTVEAEVGQVVAAAQTVVRLARPGEKEIAIAVPESLRAEISRTAAFSVTATALEGRLWTGRLRELSPAADPATRTYAARIALSGAGDELALGMSARVAMAGTRARKGVTVPLAAVHARGDAAQVWLVNGEGTVTSRPVVTRGMEGDRLVVESGLAAGDVIVVAGAQLLHAGQKVRVLAK